MNARPDPILPVAPTPTPLFGYPPLIEPDAGMDLGALFGTLWRGKWALSALSVLGAVLGLLWAIGVADPRYRATAVVVLDTGREQVVSFQDFIPSLTGDSTIVNTELEVLRSVSLLSEVVQEQGLIADPEFNRTLRPAGFTTQITSFVRSNLPIPAPPPPSDVTRARIAQNATIEGLAAALTVRNVPDSMVFEIILETGDAEKSARLADAVANRYLLRQLESKFDATQQATEWLSGKVVTLEAELQLAEAQTSRFAAEMDLISAETLEILSQQLKEVRDRIAAWQAARDRGSATGDNAARIEQLRVLEAELSRKIATQSEDLVVFEQLQREAAASRQIYEYFLGRLKETTVQQGIQQADARLMSNALVPDVPATPQPVMLALLGGLLATLAGAAALVGKEARSATFRTAEHLERLTGLPVLGQIPRIPARRRQGVLDYIRSKPASAAVEAVRNLRTSLLMAKGAGSAGPRVIMCTSSLPSEGKTTQTLALAQNYTGVVGRVLVIEGDMRRRVFRDYFGAPDTGSLLRVLNGQQSVEDAVWHNDALGFDVLFGDESEANAADIFSGPAFRRLIRTVRRTYDVVLIDTAPVLLVPDARVIGRLADAVLYTVRWDKTREKQVQQGLRSFQTIGVPVTGLVLSQINPKGLRRYGYGQDHGTYGSNGYYKN